MSSVSPSSQRSVVSTFIDTQVKRCMSAFRLDHLFEGVAESVVETPSPLSAKVTEGELSDDSAFVSIELFNKYLDRYLKEHQRYNLDGLLPSPINPMSACHCVSSPLHLRKELLDQLMTDIATLELGDEKGLSTLFFCSGLLGNETVISCSLLNAGLSKYAFHYVDVIYDGKTEGGPSEEHIYKAMDASSSRISIEAEMKSLELGKEVATTTEYYTSSEHFSSSGSSTQVFILIDPGDAFTFRSKAAKDFEACILSSASPDSNALVYVLAKGRLYRKVLDLSSGDNILDFRGK